MTTPPLTSLLRKERGTWLLLVATAISVAMSGCAIRAYGIPPSRYRVTPLSQRYQTSLVSTDVGTVWDPSLTPEIVARYQARRTILAQTSGEASYAATERSDALVTREEHERAIRALMSELDRLDACQRAMQRSPRCSRAAGSP